MVRLEQKHSASSTQHSDREYFGLKIAFPQGGIGVFAAKDFARVLIVNKWATWSF